MTVIHLNETPDAPDWSPVLCDWDEIRCCPAECVACEVPANVVLGAE